MRVGWLYDKGETVGGAELTQAEFRAAAPEGVEIVDCPHDSIDYACDRFVVHNCVQYTREELDRLPADRRILKFWHDVGSWLQAGVREWLDECAIPICCSPQQAEYMGLNGARCIPPPIDIRRFEEAAATANGNRAGTVCVGSWRNYGKAPQKVMEWAETEKVQVDFYGGGPFAPPNSVEVPQEMVAKVLAGYERFVFLPAVIEPFGRVVAEAWFAGCAVTINGMVGAGYWLQENPDAIRSAASDFWGVVLDG